MPHPSDTPVPAANSFADHDIAFYLLVYQDFNRAEWCLANLRRHYPASQVIVQSDGDPDPQYATLADADTTVQYGARLFEYAHGGQIAVRAVETLRTLSQKHVIRIDTDTEVRRRLSRLPDADYYGSRHRLPENWIQGGCIGMSLQAVRRLHASRVFHRPDAADYRNWAGANKHVQANIRARAETHGLVSFDWLLAWGMSMCNIPATDVSEICSRWQTPIPPELDCAFAHPCKHVPVLRAI